MFKLCPEIIKGICNFDNFFNSCNVKPAVFDGGNETILANRPIEGHIECYQNNDILVKIPSLPYIRVNKSVLCNCEIEAENFFPLESLAACP